MAKPILTKLAGPLEGRIEPAAPPWLAKDDLNERRRWRYFSQKDR